MSRAGTTSGIRGRRLVLNVALGFFAGVLASAGLAAEKFKRLSAQDFSQLLVGHTFSDEVHWSYRFAGAGVLDATDLGETRRGVWRFSRRELCLDFKVRGKLQSDCYEVWQSGLAVRFLRDGVVILEGKLLDH